MRIKCSPGVKSLSDRRCFLMGQAAVYVNGCIRWIGGNIDQAGLDQVMRQGIDDKSQHTGNDQGA